MQTSCRCGNGVANLGHDLGGTNAGCHGNTRGVSQHQKHIITAPKIVLVLWNDFFVNTPGAATLATQFVNDLVAGPFMNGLVQYGVARGSIATTVTISSTIHKPNKATWDSGGTDDGDQLVAWLRNDTIAIKPAFNETKLLYFIFLPSTLALTHGNNEDGSPNTNVCGWHGHRKLDDQIPFVNLFWGIIRTDGAVTSSAQEFVDSVASCASHEIVEAITDRDGEGWHGDDGNGCEIGDICEPPAALLFSYQSSPNAAWNVQQYWSNWDNACVRGDRPVSLRAFLNAIHFDHSLPLSKLGTPVISLSYMASKLA
jgi:hypothetical protein